MKILRVCCSVVYVFYSIILRVHWKSSVIQRWKANTKALWNWKIINSRQTHLNLIRIYGYIHSLRWMFFHKIDVDKLYFTFMSIDKLLAYSRKREDRGRHGTPPRDSMCFSFIFKFNRVRFPSFLRFWYAKHVKFYKHTKFI